MARINAYMCSCGQVARSLFALEEHVKRHQEDTRDVYGKNTTVESFGRIELGEQEDRRRIPHFDVKERVEEWDDDGDV